MPRERRILIKERRKSIRIRLEINLINLEKGRKMMRNHATTPKMRPNTEYIQTRKGGGRREGKVKGGKERRRKKKGKKEGKRKEERKEKERRRREKGGKEKRKERKMEGKNGPEETQAHGNEKGKTKCHTRSHLKVSERNFKSKTVISHRIPPHRLGHTLCERKN